MAAGPRAHRAGDRQDSATEDAAAAAATSNNTCREHRRRTDCVAACYPTTRFGGRISLLVSCVANEPNEQSICFITETAVRAAAAAAGSSNCSNHRQLPLTAVPFSNDDAQNNPTTETVVEIFKMRNRKRRQEG